MENKTVAQIITELKDSNLVDLMTPNILGNYLLILSAHINQAGMNALEAEQKYSQRWSLRRLQVKTDKQADIEVKQSTEYLNWRKAQYAEKALIETIRSIKKILQVKSDEARNQY